MNPIDFPAFPTAIDSTWLGITARDYFAMQALPALLAINPEESVVDVVERAYAIADAALTERCK